MTITQKSRYGSIFDGVMMPYHAIYAYDRGERGFAVA